MRHLLLAAWVGFVWLASTAVLLVAASRVGSDAPTTYSRAQTEFEASWGGRVALAPPHFQVERQIETLVVDEILKKEVLRPRIERQTLHPVDAILEASLDSTVRRSGWLTFDAYEVRYRDRYVVRNTTSWTSPLSMFIPRPEGAALVYDFEVRSSDARAEKATLGEWFVVAPPLTPGEQVTIATAFSTKGVDQFSVLLSTWKDTLSPHLAATLTVDTDQFSLLRFGIPHSRAVADGVSTVAFEVSDFASLQDLGITFVEASRDLARVDEIVGRAPVAVGILLVVVLVWAQILDARVAPFHYALVALAPLTFFLFVAYSARFLSLPASMGVGTLLTAVLVASTFPRAAFTLRIVVPYLLVVTLGFSGVFLLPVFKGIAFLSMCFLLALSVLVPLSRWPRMSAPSPA